MPEYSEPGRLVGGRYRLVARLGAGGMGRVWRAHDSTLHIDVAIKEVVLPFTLSEAQQAERLSRAEREARNTARLRDQPGVVTVHDVVVEDGVPWIVMQLVSGASLAEHVREHGPLSVENTAKVADTLLHALAAAHAAGIVHRDVKPANVLLADDGRVLLTDFGIAQHVADTSLTVTGAVVGSAEYMAPERTRGQDSGPPGDLFSLGVTLYQAVEGVSPFRRDTPTATMTAVLFSQPPIPGRAGHLAPLLAGLLAKEPAQRPSIPSALALLKSGPAAGGGAPDWPATGSGAGAGAPPIAARGTRELTGAGAAAYGPTLGPTVPPNQPPHQPSYLVQPPPRRNGLKIGLGVAAVVAVSAGATLAVTHLMGSGSTRANPPVSSGSGGPTGATAPTGPGTPTSTSLTNPTAPTGATGSTSAGADGLDVPTTPFQAISTSVSSPTRSKAGCTEAFNDLNAFNKANPAANGGKDFQIQADRKLASDLAKDAQLATDPTIRAAIQSESDSWNKFADLYQKGDADGMSKTIPETSKAIAAVNTACSS